MDQRRAAGALLALVVCITATAAAPTASNQTGLDLYDSSAEGCYYNFQHYGEGDRIMTNEPCLNCTCHNRMLMCYLRVCPFTKPIGQDCTVEKRADQCCPIVTCPDVPVDLLTSTTTSPAEYGSTGVGKLDKYGCSIHGKYFPEGSKVPPTPNKPCEHCYCIRNMTTCVMQECTLHVDGCTPIYHKDVCCPVRYSCDHPEDEIPLLDDMTTTVRPTPGFLLTTTTLSPVTQMSQDCVHDDQIFPDGALIKTEKACEHCYCMKGDIVCVVQECGTPMENEGKNCTSQAPKEGQCCPDTYICEGDEVTTETPSEYSTQSHILEDLTTRRVGVEGSGYRNEPDEPTYTEIPALETEGEGSGYAQSTVPVIEIKKSEKETPEATTEIFDDTLREGATTLRTPTLEDIDKTTEPDKGLNTVPSDDDGYEPSVVEKTTPQEETKTTKAPSAIDDKQVQDEEKSPLPEEKTTIQEPSVTPVTKLDEISSTTELVPRKDDSVTTESYDLLEDKTTHTEDVEKGTTVAEDYATVSKTKAPFMEELEKQTTILDIFAEKDEKQATKSKESTTESIQEISIPEDVKPSDVEKPAYTTWSSSIETTTSTVEKIATPDITSPDENEIEDISTTLPPGRIPGEGDCLLNEITYRNNSEVPSFNACDTGCRCVSSIVKCDRMICSPPPEYMDNCQPTFDPPGSCCPTYVCDTGETIPPQPHSQMSGTESPVPAIECHGDECELSKEKEPPKIDSSGKPVVSGCESGDCHDQQQPSVPEKPTEKCEDGKCTPPDYSPPDCVDGKCEQSPVEEPIIIPVKDVPLCDSEEDCKRIKPELPPCEGDECTGVQVDCNGPECSSEAVKPHDVPEQPHCDNEEDCKIITPEVPPCDGEECSESKPHKQPEQPICENEEDCKRVKPDVPSCEGEECSAVDVKPSVEPVHPLCDNEEDCKRIKPEEPLCKGEGCPTVDCIGSDCSIEGSKPSTKPMHEQEPEEETSPPCTEKSCRRKETGEQPSPSECHGSECKTIDGDKIDLGTELPSTEVKPEDVQTELPEMYTTFPEHKITESKTSDEDEPSSAGEYTKTPEMSATEETKIGEPDITQETVTGTPGLESHSKPTDIEFTTKGFAEEADQTKAPHPISEMEPTEEPHVTEIQDMRTTEPASVVSGHEESVTKLPAPQKTDEQEDDKLPFAPTVDGLTNIPTEPSDKDTSVTESHYSAVTDSNEIIDKMPDVPEVEYEPKVTTESTIHTSSTEEKETDKETSDIQPATEKISEATKKPSDISEETLGMMTDTLGLRETDKPDISTEPHEAHVTESLTEDATTEVAKSDTTEKEVSKTPILEDDIKSTSSPFEKEESATKISGHDDHTEITPVTISEKDMTESSEHPLTSESPEINEVEEPELAVTESPIHKLTEPAESITSSPDNITSQSDEDHDDKKTEGPKSPADVESVTEEQEMSTEEPSIMPAEEYPGTEKIPSEPYIPVYSGTTTEPTLSDTEDIVTKVTEKSDVDQETTMSPGYPTQSPEKHTTSTAEKESDEEKQSDMDDKQTTTHTEEFIVKDNAMSTTEKPTVSEVSIDSEPTEETATVGIRIQDQPSIDKEEPIDYSGKYTTVPALKETTVPSVVTEKEGDMEKSTEPHVTDSDTAIDMQGTESYDKVTESSLGLMTSASSPDEPKEDHQESATGAPEVVTAGLQETEPEIEEKVTEEPHLDKEEPNEFTTEESTLDEHEGSTKTSESPIMPTEDETTLSPTIQEQTTNDVVELEEHTHKPIEELSTISPSEQDLIVKPIETYDEEKKPDMTTEKPISDEVEMTEKSTELPSKPSEDDLSTTSKPIQRLGEDAPEKPQEVTEDEQTTESDMEIQVQTEKIPTSEKLPEIEPSSGTTAFEEFIPVTVKTPESSDHTKVEEVPAEEIEPVEEPEKAPESMPDENPTEKPEYDAETKPSEKPSEQPQQVPSDKLDDESTEVPIQEPAEKPIEQPVEEQPEDKPIDVPVIVPTEATSEEPEEKPAEESKPVEEASEKPTEEPSEKPVEEPSGKPVEEPSDKPQKEPSEKPTEEPFEKPTIEPSVKPAEEPSEKPTEIPVEQPSEEPYEKTSEESSEKPTDAPAEKPAEEPYEKATDEPAEKPTEAPAEKPVEESDVKPFDEPSDKPIEAPEEKPTEEFYEQPTEEPSIKPTETPEENPAEEPHEKPTEEPSEKTTETPEKKPFEKPTEEPSEKPTATPEEKPAEEPYEKPTKVHEEKPLDEPYEVPTESPQESPDKSTEEPSEKPAEESSEKPAEEPSEKPTEEPSEKPMEEPSAKPSEEPVEKPVEEPFGEPTEELSEKPVEEPSEKPAEKPSEKPKEEPSAKPTEEPVEKPAEEPSEKPTEEPSEKPTEEPSKQPVEEPSEKPAEEPSEKPTEEPSKKPVEEPSKKPTEEPAEIPTEEPSEKPAEESYEKPTEEPSKQPVEEPSEKPAEEPSEKPTEEPSVKPVEEPSEKPTEEPSEKPVEEPSEQTTEEPSETPAEEPSEKPLDEPSEKPAEEPLKKPTEEPAVEPSEKPTEVPLESPVQEPSAKPTDAPSEVPAEELSDKLTEAPTKITTANPEEEVSEKSTEAPVEKPVEESYEKSTEMPEEKPAEEPSDKPEQEHTEKPSETSEGEHSEKPLEETPEKSTDKPEDMPLEEPTEIPKEKPLEEPIEKPEEKPSEVSTEQTVDKSAEETTVKPAEEPTEKPAEEAEVKPIEAPSDKPADSQIDMKPSETEAPTEKPSEGPEDEKPMTEGDEKATQKPVYVPEEKPQEVPVEPTLSTMAPETPKPGFNEVQPTDELPDDDHFLPSGGTSGYGTEPDYSEEDQAFGPGTCRYGGKVYVSAQQIPRDDPCDFCFCFRSDIICLQQSCPPPIHGCHEEPIQGFCCPRYECPVAMATTLNVTTTTTTTTTTLPPHFLPHAYKGAAQRRGCQIKGHTYKVGEVVRASSGPCLHCTCGGDGQMKCDPKACTPEPMLRQMIAAAVSAKRRR